MEEGRRGDQLVAAFARWAADQRTQDAAVARARQRSLREQARGSATWAGVLLDLAEQTTPVTVVVAGQRRRGQIVGVGQDFCVLQPRLGGPALVRAWAISEVWPEDGTPRDAPTGDRDPSIRLTLTTALALLAEERAPVSLMTDRGVENPGDLLAVGDDVVTLRTAQRRLVYLPLRAVALCEVR